MGKRFSERMGLVPPKELLKEGISDEIKNRIWNVFEEAHEILKAFSKTGDNFIFRYYRSLFDRFLKIPVTTISPIPIAIRQTKRQLYDIYFQPNNEWSFFYEFIEFTILFCQKEIDNPYETNVSGLLSEQLNQVFVDEYSAYRLLDFQIIQISNETEIAEVNQAQQSPVEAVSEHIRAAVNQFSNKQNPDYRNAIKEAISAVEAMASLLTGNPKSTLGKALAELEKKGFDIHTALKEGYSKIYGYTSDEGGIRHAMSDLSTIEFEDAKYMIVSCSAFVNYLQEKGNKAGLISN